MKKLFITFFIIFTSIIYPNYVFWEWENSCSIKDSAPEEVLNYIKDIRKIISNISSNAQWETRARTSTSAMMIRWLNSIISWNDYKTEFDFFLVKPITDEIPYEIRRDDKYLWKEIDNLNRYLSGLARNWKYSSVIESGDICNWVENCDLKGKAWDVVIKLIDNTRNIRSLLQLSVIGNPGSFDKKLILVDDNFKNVITTSYSADQIKNCSDSEGWFFEQIKESIQKISWNNLAWEKSIQKWKDSWELLLGTKTDEYRQTEKRLLREELARQWVSADGTNAILENLEAYNNNWWYSMDNNLVRNSFVRISDSISSQWNSFTDSVSEVFWQSKEEQKEKVSIEELRQTSEQIDDSNKIRVEIEELYKKQIPLAQAQDLDTKRITSKLIKMHSDLWTSINTLEKTIKISQKVCNDQANWKWQCEF